MSTPIEEFNVRAHKALMAALPLLQWCTITSVKTRASSLEKRVPDATREMAVDLIFGLQAMWPYVHSHPDERVDASRVELQREVSQILRDGVPSAVQAIEKAPAITPDELARRIAVAEDEVAGYDFTDAATIVGQDGWNTSDPSDLTKIIYAEFDDAAEDEDSEKISFHCRFDAAGNVEDAYALEMRHGSDIGSRRVTAPVERQAG